MIIKSEEEKIFQQLGMISTNLVKDGIVDENEYLQASCKIMYVLKEVNGGENWDLREFLYNGGKSQTWDNIARWTEGILSLDKEIPWYDLNKDNEARRNIYLKKICAVNVKKTSGGYTADNKKVYLAAKENKRFLRQQFELYHADIIVCCGTEKAYFECMYEQSQPDWKMTSRGIWYVDDGSIVISFAHPESRTKDCFLYYSLIDAVKEIMNQR